MEHFTAPVYLFVYGTLRRADDHPMHRLLLPADLVGPGSFPGKLYDVGNYPAAVCSDLATSVVHGEIYLLHDPANTLARLDKYEGCSGFDPLPHEYVRKMVQIRRTGGGFLASQAYLYNHGVDGLTLIPSGDYIQWRSQHPPTSPP